jgi:hypothetical protein
MIQSLASIERIAASTRRDFEKGAVTDDEIIAAAIALDATYGISAYARDQGEEEARIKAGELVRADRHVFRVPLVADRRFPKGCCDVASRVLGYRLLEAGALEGNKPEIISGGCEEDTDTFDPTSYYHNPHTFVGIGETALGRRTIADITADQFRTGLPPVYIGPLVDPWTDDPNLETNSW